MGKRDNARSILEEERDDFILIWTLMRVTTIRSVSVYYTIVLANEFNAPNKL
jgi:hypothetical protein